MKASKREAVFASQRIVDRPGPVAGRCVAALACLLALAVPAQAAPGGTLTVALGGDLRSTDPGVNRDDFTDAVLSHVIEPLVTFREDLSVAPMLAESYERSADGRT